MRQISSIDNKVDYSRLIGISTSLEACCYAVTIYGLMVNYFGGFDREVLRWEYPNA